MNLFIISDILYSGYFPFILDILSLASIVFAILVITTKNPVISVLFLISLFITVGTYLITIGMSFLGLAYLLVYVGAVSILFLFILMLINIRVSELISYTKNSIPLVFIVTYVFGGAGHIILPFLGDVNSSNTTTGSITWENMISEFDQISSIGNVMYSVYAIWLIVVSTILLVAMVGAIVITIKPKPLQYEYAQHLVSPLKK